MNILFRIDHVRRPFCANNLRQPLGIKLGVQDCAGEIVAPVGCARILQHVTQLTVKMWIVWEFIKHYVMDASDLEPEKEGMNDIFKNKAHHYL